MPAVDTQQENLSYKTEVIVAAAELKFLSVLCSVILYI